jgi:polyferredoxin
MSAHWAAGWGIGVFGTVLLLGWALRLQHPGAWLGLSVWGLLSGWIVFSILKNGTLNPYRFWWFTCLALGTLGAVIGTPPKELVGVGPAVCHIALSTTIGAVGSQWLNAFFGLGHDAYSFTTGWMFLVFASLVGTAWCSWICGYGAWDESVSRISAKRPLWKWKPPQGVWKYVNVGIWTALLLITWTQRETFFCQWMCPFKLTEQVGVRAGIHSIWPMATLLSVGVGGIFFLPLITGKRTFCRYLCPFGAWQSIWSRWHPLQREWRSEDCRHCTQCQTACPMQAIRIQEERIQVDGNCNHCGRCEEVCSGNALGLKWAWQSAPVSMETRRWTRMVAIIVLGMVTGILGAGVWIKIGYNLTWVLFNKG